MWKREGFNLAPDLSPCGVLLFGDDGRLLALNDTLIRMLDLDQEALGSLRIDDLLAPAARVFLQMVLAPMLKLKGRADEVHLILRTRGGDDVHVLICGVRRIEPGGPVNHCCLVPINQRKKLEGELVQTRRAAQEVPGVIFQLELDDEAAGRFAYVSDAIERLVGIAAEELRKDAAPFFEGIHPDERIKFRNEVIEAGRQGLSGHYKFRVVHGTPPRTVWCETHATPRKLLNGSVVWNGYIADITRQKAVEEKLRETDKLQLTAMLASGIAHDFNNVLGSINGLAELCLLEATEGSRLERNLKRIMDSGLRAATLVRQMLDYSRQSPRSAVTIPFGEFLRQFEPLLAVGLPESVSLSLDVQEDGEVSADPVQLEQVLLNLVNNAGYAMRDKGGVVEVKVDVGQWPEKRSNKPLPERGLRLRVIDQGSGIAQENLANIYQPFFTTKPVGEGTGLGLSAVHGIVKAHDGRIEVESTLGKGTTFTVWLPVAQAPAAD